MEYRDYYSILGVDKKASADDIKKAYRRLARKYHPDVSKEKNAEEKFKDLQEAYEVLKDPEKKAAYDQLGSNWKSGQEFRPPPGWNQQGGTHFYTSSGDFGEDLGGFSDFFTNLFGRRSPFQQRGFEGQDDFGGFRERGSDQKAVINITLEDAYHGTHKNLQLQIPEQDPATGRMYHKLRTLKINIPAGAAEGQQLRLAGQGSPGLGGGPAGDIYLQIHIEPHRYFTLQDKDVYLNLPVTPWEVAIGAEIKIPTLGGKVGLKIAPNSQGGQKLRLKGRGMPAKPHSGDQYVVLQVLVPTPKTDEQKQLYQKMAEMMPYNPRTDWF